MAQIVFLGGPVDGDSSRVHVVEVLGMPSIVTTCDPLTGYTVAYCQTAEKDRKDRTIYQFKPYQPVTQS